MHLLYCNRLPAFVHFARLASFCPAPDPLSFASPIHRRITSPTSNPKMMPNPHVYGHHQYNPQADSAWLHQQSNHQQHHAQQQAAAAAAASAAQQQHYSRIASAHNTVNALNPAAHAQDGNLENPVSEDNRRTLAYIADLLNENTREAALLELSKKREQVPELALILWHSFGMSWRLR